MGAYRLFDRIAAKRNAGGAELLISAKASTEADLQLCLRSQDFSIIQARIGRVGKCRLADEEKRKNQAQH
jgi:hypothetical protein